MNQNELEELVKDQNILIGHDAEFFLEDGDSTPMSAIGMVGGSKEEPLETEHGWVQEDGVAAEVNIPPAASCDEFVKSTQWVMLDLHKIIKMHDLRLRIAASAVFDPDQLLDISAQISGCDPDYNAYSLEENPPADYEKTNLRAAGGHIHLSWKDAGDPMDAPAIAKAADALIVIPSLILDGDDRRRTLYGKAGAFRVKDYGVEIRSPSNFWARSEELMRWVYYATVNSLANMGNTFSDDVEFIINSNNKEMASEFIGDYAIPMPGDYNV